MKKVTFTLDDKTLEMIKDVHDEFGTSNSEIIRRAVCVYWLKVQDIKDAAGLGEAQISGKARSEP